MKLTRDYIRQRAVDIIFIFGDNLAEAGFGGQAAEARGEPNAFGVPTKKAPRWDDDAFFSDNELEENAKAIEAAIARARAGRAGRAVVVCPGIGTGRAQMPRRCPRTYAFLLERLDALQKESSQL